MRRCLLVALACCLLPGLAACAGGDRDGGGSGGGVSERRWRSDVNKVCRQNRLDVARVRDQVAADGHHGADAAGESLERSVAVERRFLDRLERTPTPAALRHDFRRFTDTIRSSLPLFAPLAASIRSGRQDPELTRRFTAIAASARPFAERHRLLDCLTD